MTEADWLKAKDPDRMLRAVADRLSDRRWFLLARGVVRRAADALPHDAFRAALARAELPTADPGPVPDPEVAVEAARVAQRAVVLPADPDLDPDVFARAADGPKPSPAAPLYASACRHAGTAVDRAGEAAAAAARAVAALLAGPPGADLLREVREAVVEATRLRTAANLHAATALELRALGDDAADRATIGRAARIQLAAAEETARKRDEAVGGRVTDLDEQKEKAERKALARLLFDLVGNPFRAYHFDPAWRTPAVVEMAGAIHAGRAFDRLPALADALLDADCDAEAVLRHCRGTEAHTPDGPLHGPGCWVVDLILGHEPALFEAPPLEEPPPPPPRRAPAKGGTAPPFLKLFDAIARGVPLDDEDDE